MTKPIIFLQKKFREEFTEKIQSIAPDYQIKNTLTEEDFAAVEISVGWAEKFEDQLLATQKLKWVQSISAGVDYLPLDKFSEQDILLSNGSGIHALSISEHIIGVLLGYYRGLNEAVKKQGRNEWAQNPFTMTSLLGKIY